MINIYLGKKFKERRIELKISLKHVEAYTQIPEAKIIQYEKGSVPFTVEDIFDACATLHINYIDLLKGAKNIYYAQIQKRKIHRATKE